MSTKRLSLRFDMSLESHRTAWDYLHRRGAEAINKEVIHCIIMAMDRLQTEEHIRTIVREAMRGMPVLSIENAAPDESEAGDALFDFLESF